MMLRPALKKLGEKRLIGGRSPLASPFSLAGGEGYSDKILVEGEICCERSQLTRVSILLLTAGGAVLSNHFGFLELARFLDLLVAASSRSPNPQTFQREQSRKQAFGLSKIWKYNFESKN